jgi:predicted nucleic acid-binding protein
MLFWDTSAVLKLYVDEPDAKPFRTLAQRPESLLISVLTVHELHCGLHRKEFVKALKPGMAEVLYQAFRDEIEAEYFRLIAYNSRVEQHALDVVRTCYGAKKPVLLRVLDALQLASALAVGATDMVSTDTRMRQGAALLGMKVFPQAND